MARVELVKVDLAMVEEMVSMVDVEVEVSNGGGYRRSGGVGGGYRWWICWRWRRWRLWRIRVLRKKMKFDFGGVE